MNPRHVVGAGLVAVAGVVAVFGFTHYHALADKSASTIANQALTAAGGASTNASTHNSSTGDQGNASAAANSQSGFTRTGTSDGSHTGNSTSGNAATASGTSRTSSQFAASGTASASGASNSSDAVGAGAAGSSGSSGAKGSTPTKQGSSSSTSSQSSSKSSVTSSTSSTASRSTSSSAGQSSSPPPASLGTFTIVVSKDRGADVLEKKTETIHSGESLMDYMKQDFQIQTVYNGQFITTIDGLKSLWTGVPVSQRQPVDWFLYVNGQEAPVGADSIMPQAGDVDTWDYHRWDPSTGRG